MSVSGVYRMANGREAATFPDVDGVVEVPLLLPDWQAEALEALAHARGLTAAELVRLLLTEFLVRAKGR